MAVILALLSALFGAWVNNVFTWKIKNKIDALDAIYLDIQEYNSVFLAYCLDMRKYPLLSPELELSSQKFNECITKKKHKMYLNFAIVDGRKAGNLYQKMYSWNSCLHENLDHGNYDKFCTESEGKSSDGEKYERLLNEILDSILENRKETTSFCYMLSQLNPLQYKHKQ